MNDDVAQLKAEVAQLKDEVVRLKRHNFTLLTMIGNLNDGQTLLYPNLMEATVLYDLMGDELQYIYQLIEEYQDLSTFKAQANAMPNPHINEHTIFYVVEAFKNNNSSLKKKCTQILTDYHA